MLVKVSIFPRRMAAKVTINEASFPDDCCQKLPVTNNAALKMKAIWRNYIQIALLDWYSYPYAILIETSTFLFSIPQGFCSIQNRKGFFNPNRNYSAGRITREYRIANPIEFC